MLTPSPPWSDAPVLSRPQIELVRGTYRVMARVGSQQLSLRQVAKELGVSPALFVYHFESKENLLMATMRWAVLETVERVHRSLAEIDDPEQALQALIEALLDDPVANRDYYLVYLDLVQYSLRNASFSGLAELLWKYLNGSYAVVIQHGVAAGVFDVEDIEVTAREARAILEGGVVQWLQDDDWQTTHARLRTQTHQALLAMLRGGRAGASGQRTVRSRRLRTVIPRG